MTPALATLSDAKLMLPRTGAAAVPLPRRTRAARGPHAGRCRTALAYIVFVWLQGLTGAAGKNGFPVHVLFMSRIFHTVNMYFREHALYFKIFFLSPSEAIAFFVQFS